MRARRRTDKRYGTRLYGTVDIDIIFASVIGRSPGELAQVIELPRERIRSYTVYNGSVEVVQLIVTALRRTRRYSDL